MRTIAITEAHIEAVECEVKRIDFKILRETSEQRITHWREHQQILKEVQEFMEDQLGKTRGN